MHGSNRNATIYCHSDVSVLCIQRDDFVDIFMHVEKGHEPEHISFLRTINLLNDWPLEKLPHHDPKICFLTFFRKGALMCKDSVKNDWVYVLKQGSCRIVKDIKLATKNLCIVKKPLNIPSNYLGI